MIRRPRRDRGAAAVEFALVMPILFILVMGIIQYGWYFYVAENTSGAASNVARRLAVGDCWTGTEAETYAKSQVALVTTVDRNGGNPIPNVGDVFYVEVEANADLLDFLPVPDGGVVKRRIDARVEDTEAEGCA